MPLEVFCLLAACGTNTPAPSRGLLHKWPLGIIEWSSSADQYSAMNCFLSEVWRTFVKTSRAFDLSGGLLQVSYRSLTGTGCKKPFEAPFQIFFRQFLFMIITENFSQHKCRWYYQLDVHFVRAIQCATSLAWQPWRASMFQAVKNH